MIKVLIADDHLVFRKGLGQILLEMSMKVEVDEAADGNEVLEKVWENNYDVVLMDISMPSCNGIDVMKQLRHDKPDLPVLIISMHPEDQYAVRAIRAGASGYVKKSGSREELTAAIDHLIRGEKYISPSIALALAAHVRGTDDQKEKPLHKCLSDREYEMMCMIASGKSLKEIAGDLSLSPKTVSSYRFRLMKKMGMKNNAELINYVIRKKLISGGDCYDGPE
jgi:two-component system invasion response regulator UvrY